MRARFLLLSAAMFALASPSSPGAPARADSEPAQSLDDQLRESLGAEPLDEFDRELFGQKAPEGEKPKPKQPDVGDAGQGTLGQESEDLKRQLLRELGAAASSEDDNPLLDIARMMREAEGLIAETESGPKTQDLQGRIVANLDELIKQARKCCKQGSPSQSSPKVAERQPVRQPQNKTSPGQGQQTQKQVTAPATKPGESGAGRPNMDQMRELIKSVWGELPEKEREQMLELMRNLEFLPKYELLIEQYFKRLVEERRSAGD